MIPLFAPIAAKGDVEPAVREIEDLKRVRNAMVHGRQTDVSQGLIFKVNIYQPRGAEKQKSK